MHPEAIFLAGYSLALVGLAAALVALGRRSTDPWASKVLAASRPPASERTVQASWLQSDVPAFHLGVSGVVLAASLVLTIVNALRHHRPLELVVHLTLLVLISMVAVRLVARHRP